MHSAADLPEFRQPQIVPSPSQTHLQSVPSCILRALEGVPVAVQRGQGRIVLKIGPLPHMRSSSGRFSPTSSSGCLPPPRTPLPHPPSPPPTFLHPSCRHMSSDPSAPSSRHPSRPEPQDWPPPPMSWG